MRVVALSTSSSIPTTMASRPPSQKVGVSYSGPPLFLASGTWKQIQSSLEAQLPFRNIHWKPAGHASIRTIQELYVNFVPLASVRDESASQVPVTVLDKPLLHLFFVACDVRGTSSREGTKTAYNADRMQTLSCTEQPRRSRSRLAHFCREPQEPGMAHHPHCTAGSECRAG